jgi:hypothetical protein
MGALAVSVLSTFHEWSSGRCPLPGVSGPPDLVNPAYTGPNAVSSGDQFSAKVSMLRVDAREFCDVP